MMSIDTIVRGGGGAQTEANFGSAGEDGLDLSSSLVSDVEVRWPLDNVCNTETKQE
jgi:hypothetical protein